MDNPEKRLTLWYNDLKGDDFPLVGKKNANLGEMLKAGIPISPGFAITIHANDVFMRESGVKAKLEKLLADECKESTPENISHLSKFAMAAIETASMPPALEKYILAAEAQCALSTAIVQGGNARAHFPPLLAHRDAWKAYTDQCIKDEIDSTPPQWLMTEFLEPLGFDQAVIRGLREEA